MLWSPSWRGRILWCPSCRGGMSWCPSWRGGLYSPQKQPRIRLSTTLLHLKGNWEIMQSHLYKHYALKHKTPIWWRDRRTDETIVNKVKNWKLTWYLVGILPQNLLRIFETASFSPSCYGLLFCPEKKWQLWPPQENDLSPPVQPEEHKQLINISNFNKYWSSWMTPPKSSNLHCDQREFL